MSGRTKGLKIKGQQSLDPAVIAAASAIPAPFHPNFRQVVETLPAAIYVTDADGRITYYNEAAVALWGYRPPLGDSRWCGSWRLYWLDGRPMRHDECPMAMALKQNRAVTGMEAYAERPDGSRVRFMPFPKPLHDETGALIGAVNMLVDVTDRRSTEQRLDDSEARYRGIFESARVALWEVDFSAVLVLLDDLRGRGVIDLRAYLAGNPAEVARVLAGVRVSDVNEFCLELFEAERKEDLLPTPSRIRLPETQAAFVEELVALWEGRRRFESETVLQTLQGRRLNVMFSVAFEGDRCEQTLVSVVDISALKTAQSALQRLAAIIESNEDAIISKNLDGVIMSWNSGAERLFGYTAEEAIGRPVTMLMPPERVDEEPGIIARIRRGERIDHYDTVRRRKDGSAVDISLTVSPIKDANGTIIGASKIARDITERKQAEHRQQLLVGEVKHRIKNLLATVQAIARQTLKGAPVEERDAFVARLMALANAQDLLTLERWNRAPVHEIVDRALRPFEAKHSARFLTKGPEEAWVDAQRASLLTMALHELATNAVKYGALSNGYGVVRLIWEVVGTEDEGQSVRLTWCELGGPPVVPPERKGFGSFLIERALQGGGGGAKLDYDPNGLICTLDVAL
jgi:PAS domain S-box-containing protein